MTHTAEEVRAQAERLSRIAGGALEYLADAAAVQLAARQLTAYADLLERREAAVTPDIVNAALKEFRRWADREDTVAMDAALHLVWPVPLSERAEAKLSERKTVHEWLNALHIEREEFGKPLCLLRRLRILCDRYQGTCDQLSHELRKQIHAEPVAQADIPDPQLCKFYGVSTFPQLVQEMEQHIAKLQAERPKKPWEDTFPPRIG